MTKEERKEYYRKWRAVNKDIVNAKKREHYKKNKAKINVYQAEYRKNNREKLKEGQRRYRQANPNKVSWKSRVRRQRIQNACPAWVDLQELEAVYKNRPEGYHVDHIIPIHAANENGEHIACGLHVPWNLQYLKACQNRAKRNRLP